MHSATYSALIPKFTVLELAWWKVTCLRPVFEISGQQAKVQLVLELAN